MVVPFTVDVCTRCGYAAHPPRIVCPRCGADDWRRQLADGVVGETTARPVTRCRRLTSGEGLGDGETHLASIRTDLGAVVIARVPEGVRRGDRVRLQTEAGTVVARPAPATTERSER